METDGEREEREWRVEDMVMKEKSGNTRVEKDGERRKGEEKTRFERSERRLEEPEEDLERSVLKMTL